MLDPIQIVPESPRAIRRLEYERMVASGMFDGEQVELLEGMLVAMSPHGAPHDAVVQRLTRLFVLALADRASVRVQSAFATDDDSVPEPDLAVVPLQDYDDGHPKEASLIIEVSDSSLAKDRGFKAKVYAECQVPEYWVVNLVDNLIEVHTECGRDGYARIARCHRGESIRLLRFPDVEFAVSDVLR